MEFVKVQRDELIQQFKEFIDLLKQCPKDMEFHSLIEFCGIDKNFLKIAQKYSDSKMKKQANEQNRKQEEQGNI